jgi:nucleoside phosphorylase
VPFAATLPRLSPELWHCINNALTDLDACMAARPDHVDRIEADPGYIAKLTAALKASCIGIEAAHLKNDLIDVTAWRCDSQAEKWARALLQFGFDPALTAEKLTAWMGQTNQEGERPGGNPVFFDSMRNSLSDFAGAFREMTRPKPVSAQTASPEPPKSQNQNVLDPILADLEAEKDKVETERRRVEAANAAETAKREKLFPLLVAFRLIADVLTMPDLPNFKLDDNALLEMANALARLLPALKSAAADVGAAEALAAWEPSDKEGERLKAAVFNAWEADNLLSLLHMSQRSKLRESLETWFRRVYYGPRPVQEQEEGQTRSKEMVSISALTSSARSTGVDRIREEIKQERLVLGLLAEQNPGGFDWQTPVNELWRLWRDELPLIPPPPWPDGCANYHQAAAAVDELLRALDQVAQQPQGPETRKGTKMPEARPAAPREKIFRVTVEWPESAFDQPKWRKLAKKWCGTFGGTLGKPDRKGDTLLVAWDQPAADALIKAAEAGDLDRDVVAVSGCRILEVDHSGECCYQFVPEVTLPPVPPATPTAVDKFATCVKDVDLLLVTSAKIEEDVLLSNLKPWPGEASQLRGSLSTITYELGMIGRYRAAHVLTTQGDTGREGVTSLVGTAISELRPKAILLLGIAFGVNRRKQRLGDVLVANSVFPYTIERVGSEKTVPRGIEMQCGRILADRFRRRRRDWGMACGHRPVEVHQGQILSGPKLIDNRAFRDELLGKYPNAIGGEMEGAGAYAAGDQAKVETILVKGICDWADGHKNDRAQPFAAAAAVSLAIHVLSQPDVLKEIGARDYERPP